MLDRVGRYHVEEKIGEGAMADVYRAYDPSIQRTLAIKVLKPEYSQIREYAVRFLREAKAAGALNQPNIVTIYDVGEVEGHPYIAMELIDGEPLNEIVAKAGRLPPEDVTAIAVQLADALRYAHGQGVVHRDIKPSNIMVLRDGRTIRILDFGIARMAEAVDAIFNETESVKTQIGQVLGSPRYMSPEQALGREIDGRSDLFSTGVVLYELLSGQKAFAGASAATLALQITSQEPTPLSEAAPETPRGLQFIVSKLMAKRPERRFQDGGQLGDALRREQAAVDAVKAEAASRRRIFSLPVRATLMVVAITALVLLLSIATVLNRQYAALQRMALTSGSATASFVANNAAVTLIGNLSLPPAERDWQPIQGFVQNAAKDPNVLSMRVLDAEGVVRGARDPEALGKPETPPPGESAVAKTPEQTVTATADGGGFRFRRAILYGGRPVGALDMVLSRADLNGASTLSLALMAMLAAVVLGSVGVASYIVARNLSRPIRRLRAALTDIAAGQPAFHLSHHRKDEFGALFDAFNLMSANLEERLSTAEGVVQDAAAAATPAALVTLPPAPPPPPSGPFGRPPEAPFAEAASDAAPPDAVAPEAVGPDDTHSGLPEADADVPPAEGGDRTVIRTPRSRHAVEG